ncbi:MAG: hypothetical protein KF708_14590 [Pirellulales bacterium]|nr:hypothetical protein [Pirellulales bacterium]
MAFDNIRAIGRELEKRRREERKSIIREFVVPEVQRMRRLGASQADIAIVLNYDRFTTETRKDWTQASVSLLMREHGIA